MLGEIGEGRMRSEAWTRGRWELDEKGAGRFSKETFRAISRKGNSDCFDKGQRSSAEGMGGLGALHC